MSNEICYICKKPDNFPDDSDSELRPYGPRGQWVCYSCAFSTPEQEKETERQFEAQFESAEKEGVPVIGLQVGPVPLKTIIPLLKQEGGKG